MSLATWVDLDTNISKKITNYLKENEKYFTWADGKIFSSEIQISEKLTSLLKNWVKVEKDYWQGNNK